ncbi:MAG: PEP-CTERM sorting domain-containing protein [Bryobacteraceae bacterium]
MRGFVLVLIASMPLCGSTIVSTSVNCNGATGGSSCSDAMGTGAWALADPTSLYVAVSAWTGYNVQTGAGEYASASASLTEDFVLTVTGGFGNGYAEPDLGAGGGGWGSYGVGWASASLGGCGVSSYGEGPPSVGCPWNSVPFVFGVPEQLTLSESANVSLEYTATGIPAVNAGALVYSGFLFFDANGQPLNDVSYSFVPGDLPPATPEPGTLLLSAIACAVLAGFARRRASRPQNR